jgi:hypothetical protein
MKTIFTQNINSNNSKSGNIKIVSITILTIITVWIFSGFFIYYKFGKDEIGPIGDMFGAINALFSGLALAGIIYTIYLQHLELKLQREELQLTRVELKRSAEAQEKLQISAQEQADALSFDTMLNILSSLINSTILQLGPENELHLGDSKKQTKLREELLSYHLELLRLKKMTEDQNKELYKE